MFISISSSLLQFLGVDLFIPSCFSKVLIRETQNFLYLNLLLVGKAVVEAFTLNNSLFYIFYFPLFRNSSFSIFYFYFFFSFPHFFFAKFPCVSLTSFFKMFKCPSFLFQLLGRTSCSRTSSPGNSFDSS